MFVFLHIQKKDNAWHCLPTIKQQQSRPGKNIFSLPLLFHKKHLQVCGWWLAVFRKVATSEHVSDDTFVDFGPKS